jgi:hypothetical protein
MKKDAYYFPHYCNARHNRKLRRVIKDLGVEGYGIYFMLLEILREQIDFRYPFSDVDLLENEFGTSKAKIETVITKYDLFQIDEQKNFFSLKFIFYLQPYIERTNRARDAAKVRWDKVLTDNNNENYNANAMQMQNKCNANQNARKVKESKVKESKDKTAAKKPADFIDKILEIFCIEYEKIKGIDYIISNKGKERAAIGKLINLNKEKNPEKKSDEVLLDFTLFFAKCISINNEYLHNVVSPAQILSNINQYKSYINNKDYKNVNKTDYQKRLYLTIDDVNRSAEKFFNS